MKSLLAKLLIALQQSRYTIQTWHNLGTPGELRESLWKIYDEHSPEMVCINTAMALVTDTLAHWRALEPGEPSINFRCSKCLRSFVLTLVGDKERVAPVDVVHCPACGEKGVLDT